MDEDWMVEKVEHTMKIWMMTGKYWLVVEPYPSEKSWSSSVGIMTFPIYGKSSSIHAPVTTNQVIHEYSIHIHYPLVI
jgi:hypothetical protein